MVTYLDTQTGGVNNDLTQGGTFQWPLNVGTVFYLNAANNLIQNQQTGQAVTFKIQDLYGSESVTVAYGKSVTRKVRGHLVTTIPATLPASPNADVHIILDDDPVSLQTQTTNQVAVTGSSGQTVLNLSATFAANKATVLYTCPPNYEATLVSAQIVSTDKWTLAVQTATNLADLLTPETTGGATIGTGAGNTVQVNPPKTFQQSDYLQIVDQTTSGGSGGTISFKIKLTPL